MDSIGETPRGVHATRVLSARKDFTLPTLVQAAYDPYLTAFADLVPTLSKAYDRTPDGDPVKARLGDQMAALRGWDLKWSEGSTETSLAVFWGEALWAKSAAAAKARGVSVYAYMLGKAGLIGARAGANGGAWLLKPPETITLDVVLRAVNGCAHLGVAPKGVKGCPVGEKIPDAVRGAMIAADTAVADRLSQISVADLLNSASVEAAA